MVQKSSKRSKKAKRSLKRAKSSSGRKFGIPPGSVGYHLNKLSSHLNGCIMDNIELGKKLDSSIDMLRELSDSINHSGYRRNPGYDLSDEDLV
jgi:hypothetical protein